MAEEPHKLQYARTPARAKLSPKMSALTVGIGLVGVPVTLVTTIETASGIGIAILAAIPLLYGLFSGRYASTPRLLLTYSGLLGLSAAASLIGCHLVTYNPADDFEGLTLFLGIAYSAIVGAALFVLSLLTAFIARSSG